MRQDAANGRLELPEDPSWVLAPNRAGVFDKPEVKPLPARSLEPKEVRVAVDATGLNFWDVFRSLGFIEEGDLGREMCGYVVDVGAEASSVSVGDRVVGLGFGAFGPQMITQGRTGGACAGRYVGIGPGDYSKRVCFCRPFVQFLWVKGGGAGV